MPTIAPALKNAEISVDAIVFGEATKHMECISSFINILNDGSHSHCIVVPTTASSMCSIVKKELHISVSVNNDFDPELAEALRQSMLEAGIQTNDNNNTSAMDEEEELRRAISLSLMEAQPTATGTSTNNNEMDLDDLVFLSFFLFYNI